MQNLTELLKQIRSEAQYLPIEGLVNHVREYLQIIILKSIYHSKFGSGFSFMGGTCLRICYNLKRYSEDLDFALDQAVENYSFEQLIKIIVKDMELRGFKMESRSDPKNVVQKSFLKFSELLQPLGLSARKDQKVHIKLEVDTRPVKVSNDQLESFFVNKYNEIFPILKHKNETLFAGKLLAILSRSYTKGRDYYDLIWYLSQRTTIDMKYLSDGIVQSNKSQRTPIPIPEFKTPQELFEHLTKIIDQINISDILKDIGRFLEDPEEEKWLKNYQQLFSQLASAYLSNL